MTDRLEYRSPSLLDEVLDITLGEAFIIACLFIGAWTIGYRIGCFIHDRISDVASG
jgi:hypothetical protein